MPNISALRAYVCLLALAMLHVACSAVSRNEMQAAAVPSSDPTWDQVLQSMSDPVQCPHYRTLKITPDARVRPWRLNAESKLWEFVLIGSGEPPAIGDFGRATVNSTTGVVLVLLPGGPVTLGAQSQNRDQANFDPRCASDEDKLHAVDILPFYIAIHELTSGAAARLFKERSALSGAPGDPLTMVSWEDAGAMLLERQLRLPTEAEWEYAARGQDAQGWWCVQDDDYLGSSLEAFGNLADIAYHNEFAMTDPYDKYASDGHKGIATPGSYQPSSFGLYDIFGNADEWCAGVYSKYAHPLSDAEVGRTAPAARFHVTKGGSFQTPAKQCRPTARRVWLPGGRGIDIGVRIAMSVRS